MQWGEASSLEIALELFGGGKSEPTNEFAAIARLLIKDRDAAWKRYFEDHAEGGKKELVRVTLTAIEGLLWQLKQHVLRDPERIAQLTIHEQAALLEESYAIDDRGIVRSQPRFLPITSSIKLVARILQKFQPEYTIDFSTDLWRFMREAVDLRNRLAHPKRPADLDVSNNDVAVCQMAFLWFSVFTLFVLELHKASWRDVEARLPHGSRAVSFFRAIDSETSEQPRGPGK